MAWLFLNHDSLSGKFRKIALVGIMPIITNLITCILRNVPPTTFYKSLMYLLLSYFNFFFPQQQLNNETLHPTSRLSKYCCLRTPAVCLSPPRASKLRKNEWKITLNAIATIQDIPLNWLNLIANSYSFSLFTKIKVSPVISNRNFTRGKITWSESIDVLWLHKPTTLLLDKVKMTFLTHKTISKTLVKSKTILENWKILNLFEEVIIW